MIEVEIGARFGRGVVVEETRVPPTPYQRKVGKCGSRALRLQCDCGREYVSRLYPIVDGRTSSCGCYRTEGRRIRAVALTRDPVVQEKNRLAHQTHGASKHPLFGGWYRMMDRCYNSANLRYADWGGRGIRVCPAWHDPTVFIAQIEGTLGPRPEGHTLDRINNDGHYEPGNVRWATPLVQNNNRRDTPDDRRR